MTEISEAAKAKAYSLLLAQYETRQFAPPSRDTHEASAGGRAFACFIQEVSDAAKAATRNAAKYPDIAEEHLAPFILPEPVDPLIEAYQAAYVPDAAGSTMARLQTELAKRGFKIVEAPR